MTKIILTFDQNSSIPDLDNSHVFHNEDDMKEWLNTCSHFEWTKIYDEHGTFMVKGGAWKGGFTFQKAKSHL